MVALVICGLALSAALVAWEPAVGRGSDLAFSFGVAFFTFVGAVIVWRQPGNRMGQLFAAIGLLWVTGDLAGRYSTYAHLTGRGDGVLAGLGAWYGEWYWFVFLMLTFSLMPQLFPTGRPLPGRWTTFTKVVVVFTICISAATMLEDELVLIGTNETIHNPIGIPGFHDIEEGPTALLVLPGGLLAVIGGLAAIVIRFRRSRGDERLQLKWFTLAVVALVTQFVVQSFFGGEEGHLYPVIDGIALGLVPTTAAIAILRYRLYDFDVVVNRALVYGALSAILAGTYFGIVVVLQGVLAPITSDSDVAVAGSTLAVAALFGPLRREVQGFIDRRFYRHRYDAQRTLEDFNARLRNDVDLEHLTADLVGVVHETVQPAHASVWLRPGAAS
jgi:hypothetical protein